MITVKWDESYHQMTGSLSRHTGYKTTHSNKVMEYRDIKQHIITKAWTSECKTIHSNKVMVYPDIKQYTVTMSRHNGSKTKHSHKFKTHQDIKQHKVTKSWNIRI